MGDNERHVMRSIRNQEAIAQLRDEIDLLHRLIAEQFSGDGKGYYRATTHTTETSDLGKLITQVKEKRDAKTKQTINQG